jgi:hypothetical protein
MNNQDYEAKQAARKFAADALKQAFPHLVPVSNSTGPLIAAAKNVRIELKAAFPGIKFQVTTSRFAGGNSLRVSWTDGPTSARVQEIAERYSAGDFDGMTDCYNYRKDHAWVEAFGSAKYVQYTRDYSPALTQKAIDHVWATFCPVAEKVTVEDVMTGRARSVQVVQGGYPGDSDAQVQVYRFSYQYDCMTNTVSEEYRY